MAKTRKHATHRMNPKSLKNLKPFEPGHAGRPKGSRNLLDASFVEALYADFQEFGPKAIIECRETKPDAYLKTIAAILPKDVNVSVNASETFERLLRAISDGPSAAVGDVGEGISQQPGQSTPVRH